MDTLFLFLTSSVWIYPGPLGLVSGPWLLKQCCLWVPSMERVLGQIRLGWLLP